MSISLRGICKSFDGRAVLRNVDLDIPEHGVLRIKGPSGCGKTTLLRVIAGLLTPDSGTVTGTDALKIAYVFQEDRLLPWRSTLQNVALVSDQQQARRWLTAVGLGGDMAKLPGELSGGMRRRAAIARALAFRGDMLILDEPFSGIDETRKREMIAPLIADYAREHPVLLVTHDALDVQMIGEHQVFAMALDDEADA